MHKDRVQHARQLRAEGVEAAVAPRGQRVKLLREVGWVPPRVEVLEEVSGQCGASRGRGRGERGRDGGDGDAGGGGGRGRGSGEGGWGCDPKRGRGGGEPGC